MNEKEIKKEIERYLGEVTNESYKELTPFFGIIRTFDNAFKKRPSLPNFFLLTNNPIGYMSYFYYQSLSSILILEGISEGLEYLIN